MAGSTTGRRIVLAVLAAIAGGAVAHADEPRLAIKGYDPVAYFDPGKPVPGEERFTTVWDGARWRFASAEHQATFQSDPDRYAPRYGGWCAVGMTLGGQFEVDPNQWVIIDGALYLTGDQVGLIEFQRDAKARIAEADRNWTRLH